jgi:dihydroorotate dehydrogenase
MLYEAFIRPALFQLDAEAAHERALRLAARLGRNKIMHDALETLFCVQDRRLRQTIFGVEFPNPVGLAAGFDKNAVGLECWPVLGFGFVEIGSVTARRQGGNPSPRLFRLPEQCALINRMGFNNDGAERIAARISSRAIPVGINVGKNGDVDLQHAAGNYAETMAKFRGHADFFVLNVSSPNTPGLRKLQGAELLRDLLAAIHSDVPVLLKIAPDLTFDQLDEILKLSHKLAGVVATNTTVDHPPPEGGLSGAPLRARATECVRHIWRQTKGRLPVIGVGGIFSAADAYEKIRAGASLVEVWTGWIYKGPALAREINRGLLRLLERDGFGSIAEAVGAE